METSHAMTVSFGCTREFILVQGQSTLSGHSQSSTECDVVDIIPAPNLHIKLAVEDAKLKCVHETTHFQLTENSMELEGGKRGRID